MSVWPPKVGADRFGGAATLAGAVLGWGSTDVAANTTTRYLEPWYARRQAPTAPIGLIVPRAGTLRNLFVRHYSAAGNGNSIVYTVRINGVVTTLTVSLVTGAVGTASDLVNTAVVAQGDLVDIEVTKAASVVTAPTPILAYMELS